MCSFKAYISGCFMTLLSPAFVMGPFLMGALLAHAEAANSAAAAWHSDQVIQLIGLPGVGEKVKGSLSISASPASLIFATAAGHTAMDRAKILSVTVGDERREMGRTAGRVTRAIIPFGGGAAVATVTNKQVGLLTIEFLDEHDALHGVVFLLPKQDAVRASELLGSAAKTPWIEPSHADCRSAHTALNNLLEVAPIAAAGEPIPAEYKVLLYEQLISRLREKGTFAEVFRAGDDGPLAVCPAYTILLTLSAFKKGNAAVRASTGPVGFFVGTTSLKYHVQVHDRNGKTLLDKDFKASERGDSESLNVAAKIAGALTKKLKRVSTDSPWS